MRKGTQAGTVPAKICGANEASDAASVFHDQTSDENNEDLCEPNPMRKGRLIVRWQTPSTPGDQREAQAISPGASRISRGAPLEHTVNLCSMSSSGFRRAVGLKVSLWTLSYGRLP